MDEDSVKAEQLLYQVGELGQALTNAEFADVPVDKLVLTRLLHEAKAVYQAATMLLRSSMEKQTARDAADVEYDASVKLLMSPCVNRQECKFLWEQAKADPAVRDLVQRLRTLRSSLTDSSVQDVVKLMKKLESMRPSGASNSPYPLCMMTGFPCSVTLIERKTVSQKPKAKFIAVRTALQEAELMFHYAQAVTQKYVLELESTAPVILSGGAVQADEHVPAPLAATFVYLEANPDDAADVVESFYAQLPVHPDVVDEALLLLDEARIEPDALQPFLLGGGVLRPLESRTPLRARAALSAHYSRLWQSHLLHSMGPVPKYSYDAVGDRSHIVVQ